MEKRNVRISIEKFKETEQKLKSIKDHNVVLGYLKDKLAAEKKVSRYFQNQVQHERDKINSLNIHIKRSTEDLSKEIERRIKSQKAQLKLMDEKYLWMSRYYEEKMKPWWKKIFN